MNNIDISPYIKAYKRTQGSLLDKIKAVVILCKLEEDLHVKQQRLFTIQQAADMMVLAAAREFGFGEIRNARLMQAFNETWDLYVDTAIEDAKGDEDIEYTRQKIDDALKIATGENFMPWAERYKF